MDVRYLAVSSYNHKLTVTLPVSHFLIFNMVVMNISWSPLTPSID